jgi:hypothetical protein
MFDPVPASCGAVGLIHLDRVGPIRYRPARPVSAADRLGPGGVPGRRWPGRCAGGIWLVLLFLGAALARMPDGTHAPPCRPAWSGVSAGCMTGR